MSEERPNFTLAPSDTILLEFDLLYHKNNKHDYDKLKGQDKILEDAIRTAYFSGFHQAEETYHLREFMEKWNK